MSQLPRAQDGLSLPRGFTAVRDILDGCVRDRQSASIIGVVKEYRAPIPTKGADYKSILRLYDTSTDDSADDVEVHIFRKEAEMPVAEAGDVVIVSRAKVQNRNGSYSLMTGFQTEIHIYDNTRLAACKKRGSAKGAIRPPPKTVKRDPDAKETEYALWMFERIDKSLIPDQEKSSQMFRQSVNVKDKFTLLQDVCEGKFADLIVQVVKRPYYEGDMITLWVSDYTENPGFFLKTTGNADWADGIPVRDGDEYGYLNSKMKPLGDTDGGDWAGPLGKMSMQITCWHPHAGYIQENVEIGHWLRLRNVQIAYGHNTVNIEGKLREDRAYPKKINVQVFDVEAERETIDPRLKDAIRRRRDYEKEHKQVSKIGQKRKAEDEPPKQENAKSKRKRQRAEKLKALEAEEATKEAALAINPIVVCEHQDRSIVPLSTILKPVMYNTTIANEEVHLELPFTCATYRTNVRVVDFHPASLKDFAVGRTATQYDVLSDNELSDNEDSNASSTSSGPSVHSTHSQSKKRWEWCFAIKLEEVVPPSTSKANPPVPAQTWAVVDDHSAQLLLSTDAADLHNLRNTADVDALRERLFKLWGNLEERKVKLETKRRQHVQDPLRAPPPDSSDGEGDGVPSRRQVTAAESEGGGGRGDDGPPGSQLSNRPFTCCVRQYGIKVRVKDGEVATAGEGKKWQRMFGLFGTKIRDE